MAHELTHNREAPPLRKAAVKAIAAFLLGLTIYGFLLILARVPILFHGFFMYIETIGEDFGTLIVSRRLIPGVDSEVPVFSYVLLDIDDRTCDHLNISEPNCLPGRPVPRDVLAALITKGRVDGARIVIVDVISDWSSYKNDRIDLKKSTDALSKALENNSDVPVIVPLFYRFTGEEGRLRTERRLSGPSKTGSRVYFGIPAASSRQEARTPTPTGGVVRDYPRTLLAQIDDEDAVMLKLASQGTQECFTLPGLAESLLQGKTVEVCEKPKESLLLEDSELRIQFTIPHLNSEDPAQSGTRFQLLVKRYTASEVLDPNSLESKRPGLLKDKIVIIGSSRDIRDWHLTPIGEMTGSEVVLNATRAYIEQRFVPNRLSVAKICAKLVVIAVVSVLLFVYWLVECRLRSLNIINRNMFRNAVGEIFSVVIFVGFIAIAAIAVASGATAIMVLNWGSQVGFDLATPAFATALDFFLEVFGVLPMLMHNGVEAALELTTGKRSRSNLHGNTNM